MTIILNLTHAPNYTVEDYNGASILLTTPDIDKAVDRTLREAHHYDAVIRVAVGNHASSINLLVSPRALRAKICALQLLTYLLAYALGLFRIYKEFTTAPRALAFLSPTRYNAPVKCQGCAQSSDARSFHSHGPCATCHKPTCDLCSDRSGYCVDCTPFLINEPPTK